MTRVLNKDCPPELKAVAHEILCDKQKRIFGKTFDPSGSECWFKSKLEFESKNDQVVVTKLLANLHFSRNNDSISLLDIGCGFGTFVIACASEGFNAIGTDIAEDEILFANKRLEHALGEGQGRRFFVTKKPKLPFPDASFEIVTLWSVIEHVSDWRSILQEACRLLAPNGLLLVHSPNYLGVWREPHYEIPWFPLFPFLPRQLVAWYIQLTGRNPKIFNNEMNLVTLNEVKQFLKSKGLDPCYGNRKIYEFRHQGRRLSLGALYQCYCSFPFRRSIMFFALKK